MHEIFSNLTKTHKTLLIICLFTALGSITLLIKNTAEDAHYQNAKMYNTAVHAESGDAFNYAVDSQQGNIITFGIFNTPEPVSRYEVQGQYFKITKAEEEYTRHTEYYECGTEESPQTCTRTYYSWDYSGSDTDKAQQLNLHGRNYPSDLFNVPYSRHLDCDVFIVECDNGYQYEDSNGWWASEGDLRWYYYVTDTSFTGTILINTYGGQFKQVRGPTIDIDPRSVADVIKDANDSTSITIFIIVLFMINIGICIALFKEQVIES